LHIFIPYLPHGITKESHAVATHPSWELEAILFANSGPPKNGALIKKTSIRIALRKNDFFVASFFGLNPDLVPGKPELLKEDPGCQILLYTIYQNGVNIPNCHCINNLIGIIYTNWP
jgi:hypothetical protein